MFICCDIYKDLYYVPDTVLDSQVGWQDSPSFKDFDGKESQMRDKQISKPV